MQRKHQHMMIVVDEYGDEAPRPEPVPPTADEAPVAFSANLDPVVVTRAHRPLDHLFAFVQTHLRPFPGCVFNPEAALGLVRGEDR